MGNVPCFSDVFIRSVSIGDSSGVTSLSRSVGIGSNSQLFDGALMIYLVVSSMPNLSESFQGCIIWQIRHLWWIFQCVHESLLYPVAVKFPSDFLYFICEKCVEAIG